jgi:hypothetical protein
MIPILKTGKRRNMSIREGVDKARERNKKQDERKKEIDKSAEKYKVGGGGANRYGPHKVDVNRQATESLFGRGPIQEKIIKFADKFDKKSQGGEMKPLKAREARKERAIKTVQKDLSSRPEMKELRKKTKGTVTDTGSTYSMGGEMKKGYGAARQSGMGLQDENLQPGKSMDYYKDLI